MVRLFVAVELSEAQREALSQMLAELKDVGADVKWVEAENLHVTLKFIGEVQEKDVEKVKAELSGLLSGKGSFAISLKGVGCFPGWDYMKVLWVGIGEGADELAGLAAKLGGLSFGKKDARGFKTHVTLGRVKSARAKEALVAKMKEFAAKEFGGADVAEVKLKKSVLTPKGPIYSDVAVFKLEPTH
jgi:2'-5' RNA ligase